MTARELVIPGQHRFTVTGEGYRTDGEIKHVGGAAVSTSTRTCCRWSLCADAVLDGDNLIGDPTEGALIVLAAKGGLDIDETRAQPTRASPRSRSTPTTSSWPPSTR